MLSVVHKLVRERGASVKNLKSRQIASKFGTEPISMVLIMNINKDFQNIVTKVLQMAQRVAQKWHKCPKIEIALNYLKIGTEAISGMLITNINRTFWEYYHQSAPNGTQSGTKSGTNVQKLKSL